MLKPCGIAPELLLTYLRLPQICKLMDLHTSASMYPAISTGDLVGLPFAHPGKGAEGKVVASIRLAFAARRKSEMLLEAAKRCVEIAIESTEKEAVAHLKDATII